MKKLITILFAVALGFNLSAQVPDYVPAEGLVGWWPFNGDANDESEFANNGVVNGATLTTDRVGTINSAYLFDGLDDFIRSTSVISNVDTASMSMWIQLNSNQGGSFIHIGHDSNYPNCDGFGLGNGGGTYHWEGLNLITLSSCVSWINSTVDLTVSNWFHLVFVKENLSGSYYLDGDFLVSQNLMAINQPSDSVYFGNVADSGALSMHGKLDDVGIWDRALTDEEVLGLYNAELPVSGCTDSAACNFNAEANMEDDSCLYPLFGTDCETGAAACGEGTEWDVTVQACVVSDFCQEDLDGDGVIGVNDLMQLLSMFGTDCPVWTCGDPVNYHDYDYATVQIGEQCWFAENGRFLPHVSPPDLGSEDDGEPHAYVYGYIGADPIEAKQSIQYQEAGALYNQKAVMEWNLCPSGWHVPDANEVISLSDLFGGTGSIGGALKTTGTIQAGDGVWNEPNTAATNASGFSAIPGGARNSNEVFTGWSSFGYWRTTTPENGEDVPWHFCLAFFDGHLTNNCSAPSIQGREGYAVRCLKDTE
jgi:uncharacterized protein (TIGR02145 family)